LDLMDVCVDRARCDGILGRIVEPALRPERLAEVLQRVVVDGEYRSTLADLVGKPVEARLCGGRGSCGPVLPEDLDEIAVQGGEPCDVA